MAKPPVELTVEGRKLREIQRTLTELPVKTRRAVVRELNKGLREGAAPLVGDARSAARSRLPHTGGLNERIASAPMRVQVGSSKREPGVKIVVKGVDARSTNSGRLRHPVYGNREAWVTQQIKPGWFTDTMRKNGPKIRPHLRAALQRAADRMAADR